MLTGEGLGSYIQLIVVTAAMCICLTPFSLHIAMIVRFLEASNSVLTIFFCIDYVLCIPKVHLVSKILRYGSVVVKLSNFAGHHYAVAAWRTFFLTMCKVFFVSYASKTSVLQQFNLLLVVVLQQRSQNVFS